MKNRTRNILVPDKDGKVWIGVTQDDLRKVAAVSEFAAKMLFETWKEAYHANDYSDMRALPVICDAIDKTLHTLPETVKATYIALQQNYLDNEELNRASGRLKDAAYKPKGELQ